MLRHGCSGLLLVLLLCIIYLRQPVHGLNWNELPAPPPLIQVPSSIVVTVNTNNFFAQTLAAATNQSLISSSSCQTNSSATVSLIITLGGSAPNAPSTTDIYLLPWPLTATRSGQQRWIKAPIVGPQPTARSSHTFLSPNGESAIPGWNGQAFVFSGGTGIPDSYYFSALWNLNVETSKWTPLGPSRLYDPNHPTGYECNGRPTIWHRTPLAIPHPTVSTVENCYYSSISIAQTDEFGCPWPYARDATGGTIVDGAMYFLGGFLMSGETVSDLWRLKLDSNLQLAIEQQSTSVGGVYVYNADQLKYLANSSDPTINRERLCPVKWELLSRPLTGTAQLVNQPLDAPYPKSRFFASFAGSGSYLLVSGGFASLTSNAVRQSVWLLDTRILVWTKLSMDSASNGLVPSARGFGALFAMTFNQPIGDYLDDPTDPAVVACGNRNLTVIVSGAGQDPSGSAPNDMYLGIPNCTATLPSTPALLPATDSCNSSTSYLPFPDNAPSVNWSWHKILPAMLPSSLVIVRDQNWLKIGDVILSVFGLSNKGYASTVTMYDFKNKISAPLSLPFASSQLATLTPLPTIPNPRSLHASFLINREMYVYGGIGLSQTENELWTYQVDRYEWTLVGSCSLAINDSVLWPPFTQSATVVISPASSRIYQYGGGLNEDVLPILNWNLPTMTCNSHIYMLDPNTNQWTNLTSLVQSVTQWNNQTSAQSTGGQIIGGFLYPRARCGAQGVILGESDSESLYIFGGILDSTGPSYSADNALWKLNLTSLEWSLVQSSNIGIISDTPSHQQPTSRFYHNMLRLNSHRFFMCFGTDWKSGAVQNYGSCWSYDSFINQWQLLIATGSGPAARALVAISLYGPSTILLYGGADRLRVYSDTWSLNLDTFTWTPLYPGPTNAPSNLLRSRHTMIALEDVHQLLVYGGLDDDPLVHVLHVDDQFTCGGQSSESFLPHDWLSSIEFASNTLPFQPSPFAFQTLKGALYYIQTTANIASASITILDTDSVYSTRTTQFLSTITIDRNITINGLPNQATLLACDSSTIATDCSLVINTHSVMSGGGSSCAVTNTRPTVVELNGFTFRDGHSTLKGGAVWISNSVVNIHNITFFHNQAGTFGGAVAAENSEVTVTNCSLMNNTAAQVGGGIFSINSKLTIARSTFNGNSINGDLTDPGVGQGGGVGVISTTLAVSDTLFNQNFARIGGGITSLGMPTPVTNAESSLGLRSTTLKLIRTAFSENVATESGGGVYFQDLSAIATFSLPPYLDSCQFTGNTAGSNGGGIYLTGSIMVCNNTQFNSNICFNGGGGGVFWQRTDQASTPPTFLPSLTNSNITTINSTDCISPFTSSNFVMDSYCNRAMYGPFIASPAESLKFGSDGLDATMVLQSIGTFISPGIQLWIVDAFNQTVTTDSNTFVSVRPIRSFSGTTTVQADSGEIRFDQLILKISPTSEVSINFTSAPLLPLLERDTSAGLLAFTLQSNSDLSSGLKSTGNHSLIQAGSCSAGCTYSLPVDLADAHLTVVQLSFDLSLFKHDYDRCNILLETNSGQQVFKTFIGSDVIHLNSQSITNNLIPSTTTKSTINSYVTELDIPSTRVTIALQTGDESVGYVTIDYTFVTECPPGLHFATDACLEVVQSSSITRNIIIAFASLAAVCIVISIGLLIRYQNAPLFRAASLPFTFSILGFLLLLPIASILFSLVPSEGVDGICLARVWFGSMPIIGIVAILFAKALRVATISNSNSLSVKIISYQQMWLIVLACLAIQLAFCISFTVLPLSKSVLKLRDTTDSADELVRECSIESGFSTWFGVQLGYVACLCIGAAYLSFLARGVSSQFNESSHVANALFMLILVAVILIPVGILVQDQSDAMVIIQGGGAAFISLMWTAVLFLPKFSYVRRALNLTRKQLDQQRRAELQAQVTAKEMRLFDGAPPTPHTNQRSMISLSPLGPATGLPKVGTGSSGEKLNRTGRTRTPVQLNDHHDIQMAKLSSLLAQVPHDQAQQQGPPISFHIIAPHEEEVDENDDSFELPQPPPSLAMGLSPTLQVRGVHTNSRDGLGPDSQSTDSSSGLPNHPTTHRSRATRHGDRMHPSPHEFDDIIGDDHQHHQTLHPSELSPSEHEAAIEDMRAVRHLGGTNSSTHN